MEHKLLQIGIDETDTEALRQFYERLRPFSVLNVYAVYHDRENKDPYKRETNSSTIGYYSSLGNALEALQLFKETFHRENIYAYFIEEMPVDHHLEEDSPLSVRSYNKDGRLNDECLENQNLCNAFKGRPKEKIKHNIGDIVECLSGKRLFLGIVAGLPPTPEDNFPVLDALDDCYLILPYSDKKSVHVHAHIPCTHVFTPKTEYSKKIIKHLRQQLENSYSARANSSIISLK